jgi:hypothetical protein
MPSYYLTVVPDAKFTWLSSLFLVAFSGLCLCWISVPHGLRKVL